MYLFLDPDRSPVTGGQQSTQHSVIEALTEAGHQNTIQILERFGNVLSDAHKDALRRVHRQMSESTVTDPKKRIAFALPTGIGKTTAVIGHIKAIYELKLSYSLLICQHKVEALCELYRNAQKYGIPKEALGLVHSYGHDPERAERGDEGYATEAATPEGELHTKQFLLLTHNKVKASSFNLDKYYTYKGKKRNLCIWDESLIAAEGRSLDKSGILGHIAKLVTTFDDQRRTGRRVTNNELALREFLQRCKSRIEDAFSRDHSSVLHLPGSPVTESGLKRAVDSILDKMDMSAIELRRLIDFADKPCRTLVSGNQAIIQYDIVVPDVLDNVVILDASAPIRELKQLDKSIEHSSRDNLFKDYSPVVFHHWKGRAGREAVEGEFLKGTDNAVAAEVVHIIKGIRETKPTDHLYLFTYKNRGTDRSIEQRLRKALADVGIDPDAKDSNGERHINFLTWGMETNLNAYSHCKHALFVGIMYLPLQDVAAVAAGQARLEGTDTDLLSQESLLRIRLSEQVHLIYQAVSRGHSRRTCNGRAGGMHAYFFHGQVESLKEGLDKIMPGAQWTAYRPKHMKNGQTFSQEQAFRLQDALNRVPVDRIATRRLKREHFSDLTRNQWRETVRTAKDRLVGWKLVDRSFVRKL